MMIIFLVSHVSVIVVVSQPHLYTVDFPLPVGQQLLLKNRIQYHWYAFDVCGDIRRSLRQKVTIANEITNFRE